MKPFTSKHSIAAGSPLHVGGSKKDKEKSVQPNRADVEVDKTTRLTREGTIVKSRNSGGVVIGGGYDSLGDMSLEQLSKRVKTGDNEKNNSMAIRWRYQGDW